MSEKVKKILEEAILSLEKVTNKKAKTILKKLKKAKNKI
jgi:hypothetical protein